MLSKQAGAGGGGGSTTYAYPHRPVFLDTAQEKAMAENRHR
jgi:hypothetical protein